MNDGFSDQLFRTDGFLGGITSAEGTSPVMVAVGVKEKGKPAPLVPGLQIKGDTIAGRYRLEKLLGAGSSGFVVAARHVYLRRRVTLKLLTTTTSREHAQRRHLAAAHRAAELHGPHIAHVLDTGFTEEGTPFIATERLEGRTLAEELAERTQLPPAEAVRWILQACEGLAEAHAAGLVHGDLKPQNLFLAGDAEVVAAEAGRSDSRVLKILDFGMATPFENDDDGASSPWFASPAYLAPEQIRDPSAIDARTDIWALGVILYEAIAGALPFVSDSVAGMLVAVAADEAPMLAVEGTPFALARVVQACLSKDPAGRPADVAVLARELAPFAGAEGNALARHVEEALAPAPRPATTDLHGEEDETPSMSTDAPAPRPTDAPAPTRSWTPPRSLDDIALRRRRLGVAATAGAAAVLAVVGMLSSPKPPAAPKGRRPDPIMTVDPANLKEPLPQNHPAPPPFVPPSFEAEKATEEAERTTPLPTVPSPAPTARQRVAPPPTSLRTVPVGNPLAPVAARAIPRDTSPPGAKLRSSLAVRENPYERRLPPPRERPR